MGSFLLRAAVTGLALWVVTLIVPGINFVGGDTGLQRVGIVLVVAVIFGLVNAIIKPIVQVLSIPLYILTLGLIHVVINALMLWITRMDHRAHHALGSADQPLLVDRDLGRDRAVDRELGVLVAVPQRRACRRRLSQRGYPAAASARISARSAASRKPDRMAESSAVVNRSRYSGSPPG